uniref:U-box domain-containing protein 35-like n=1 Tax=Rhizophora mucronata TaxID=61149 RepID=A0A2P2JZM0_RHIMU
MKQDETYGSLPQWKFESALMLCVVSMTVGKLPKSQVSAQQVESYMAQERGKRRQNLQKFLNMCSASKVKTDTVLIESDMIGKAILDLIPVLNMRKLVLGTSKSSLRKLRARKGNGVADQVLQNAPDYCEIKIICDGKEALDQMSGLADDKPTQQLQEQPINDSFACMCFKQPRVR